VNAATIFVLALAGGLVAFVAYLAVLSRRTEREENQSHSAKSG